MEWSNLIDIVISDEGDMYTLEYGKGWFQKNSDARLSRIKFNKGNRSPSSRIEADKTAGAAPHVVTFDGTSSTDPDGDELNYSWDFGDGATGEGMNPSHSFDEPGVYNVSLVVTDKDDVESENQIKIYVGNEPPNVQWNLAGANEMFYWKDIPLKYSVDISDEEDGKSNEGIDAKDVACLLYTSPSPRDKRQSRMPSSA